jgi:DNA-binding NarL/FixJ family response regulator
MPARILVVDDHEIVREGIRTLITRSRRGWEICGEARDGDEAIEAAKTLQPDVVVLDITMPTLSGLEAASQIAGMGLGCRILMFTMHESERLAIEVRQADAQGLVLKSQAARDLIRAIDCLLVGGTFFGSESGPKSEPEMRSRPALDFGSGRGSKDGALRVRLWRRFPRSHRAVAPLFCQRRIEAGQRAVPRHRGSPTP